MHVGCMLSESQFEESDLATHRLGDGQTRASIIAHRIYVVIIESRRDLYGNRFGQIGLHRVETWFYEPSYNDD